MGTVRLHAHHGRTLGLQMVRCSPTYSSTHVRHVAFPATPTLSSCDPGMKAGLPAFGDNVVCDAFVASVKHACLKHPYTLFRRAPLPCTDGYNNTSMRFSWA